jgi:hypothetical protein
MREPNDATEDLADLIEMGDTVCVARSGETGIVDGFMAIGSNEPEFLLLYVDVCGKAARGWFRASELELIAAAAPAAVGHPDNVIAFPQ